MHWVHKKKEDELSALDEMSILTKRGMMGVPIKVFLQVKVSSQSRKYTTIPQEFSPLTKKLFDKPGKWCRPLIDMKGHLFFGDLWIPVEVTI